MKTNPVIFSHCNEDDIDLIIHSLCSPQKQFEKGEVIFSTGDNVDEIGIVVSGSVRIESVDVYGNNSILSIVKAGEIFAEAYACTPNKPIMVDVVANEKCSVLFLSVKKLFDYSDLSPVKNKIIKNLITISSQKNIALSQRIFHTSSKTIRGRLLSYFSQEISLQASKSITIPFNRQQLADYLSIDRSALSKELGKMRADGIIDWHKNKFIIHTEDNL